MTKKQEAIARTLGVGYAKAIMYPEKQEHYHERAFLVSDVIASLVSKDTFHAIASAATDYQNQILSGEGYVWDARKCRWINTRQ